MELGKTYIQFLGNEIGQGKLKLQKHIGEKLKKFPEKIEDLKTLQQFLGLCNYTRPFVLHLNKIMKEMSSHKFLVLPQISSG